MATPIYNQRGEISGCMTILQDHSPITQLIDRLHYEERNLKIILDHLDPAGAFSRRPVLPAQCHAHRAALLKERRSDLPLLIRHIVRSLCAARAVAPPAIAKSAMQILLNYDYPGNVRELENILEHALIICREATIQPDHLPDYVEQVRRNAAAPQPSELLAAPHHPERQRILAALEKSGGHRRKAAHALGMERTTLWRKMKKYGIGG